VEWLLYPAFRRRWARYITSGTEINATTLGSPIRKPTVVEV
jgi:hypothetical protein